MLTERARMGLDGVIPGIDTTKPHPARVYDFLLGGKDNFAADRMVAERLAQAWPAVRQTAWENRAFTRRAVRGLVAEGGVPQFLDIGCRPAVTSSPATRLTRTR